MEIVALRATVTCIAMGVFLLIYDRHLFRIHLKDLWCFLGTGIMSIVFFNYCYFKAMTVASLSVAAVLLYTAPAIVMVLSYFLFQEAFTKQKVLALLLTFIGCILVTGVITNPGQEFWQDSEQDLAMRSIPFSEDMRLRKVIIPLPSPSIRFCLQHWEHGFLPISKESFRWQRAIREIFWSACPLEFWVRWFLILPIHWD